MMPRAVNHVARHSSRMDRRESMVLREACLLCRILWPTIVQHRHLLFDLAAEAKVPINEKSNYPKRGQV